GRARALQMIPVHRVREQIAAEECAAEFGGIRVALVDDPARGHVSPGLLSGIGERYEIPECVRIVEQAMLGETLPVIAALDHGAGDEMPVTAPERIAAEVEVESPGVPTPFGEELEFLGPRMVAPDPLLELEAADLRRDGAPLRAVQPAVGPPLHRIDDRVR